MAMGMEIMVNTLFKVAGIEPEMVQAKVKELMLLADQAQPMLQQLMDWNVKMVTEMDARIKANEAAIMHNTQTLEAIREQNAQIIALLSGGVVTEVEHQPV